MRCGIVPVELYGNYAARGSAAELPQATSQVTVQSLAGLQGGDREKFAAAIADSTANFAKTTADDDRPRTSVAVQESILAALAYERGWIDLEFGLPIAARLVTHQSLELK